MIGNKFSAKGKAGKKYLQPALQGKALMCYFRIELFEFPAIQALRGIIFHRILDQGCASLFFPFKINSDALIIQLSEGHFRSSQIKSALHAASLVWVSGDITPYFPGENDFIRTQGWRKRSDPGPEISICHHIYLFIQFARTDSSCPVKKGGTLGKVGI